MKDRLYAIHEKRYGKGDGLTTGEIAQMFGKPGGGIQHDVPFNMKELCKMNMIKKVKIKRK